MKTLIVFSVLLFLTSYQPTFGQTVKEMKFDQLEPYLHRNNDTVYVVNFWATWCEPCVEEIPMFLSVADAKKQEKVKFIFVSLDFAKQKESRLIPFIKKNHMDETVVLLNDPNSNRWINKVDPSWSGAIPATVVYKGNDKSFFEKQMDYNELMKVVNDKLNQ